MVKRSVGINSSALSLFLFDPINDLLAHHIGGSAIGY